MGRSYSLHAIPGLNHGDHLKGKSSILAHVARRGPWLSSWSFKASSPMPVWSRAPSQTSTKGTPGFETRQVFLGATTVCGASQLIKPETAAARGSVADHSRSYWMSD